ncbi:MAG: UDP-N-acetylmuramoyl-L-alanyl-D-glutamate--2,6-diaminopimelate ligase [Candidatus Eremiobacteraeota bacterium]|nr:UDP-N-acetylmuramoyl-L-alanyl-D-glutamate--2,6-diaminopimelate ligase [Candidatus Eremiobacteraeota bacterium]
MNADRTVALEPLLSRLPEARVTGDRSGSITAIEMDSRKVEPGALFVALHGAQSDGHRYIADALARGARALVVDERVDDVPPGVTLIRVADTRRALSGLAAAFFDDPSQRLDVIGVTGTNGKTTVAHMVAAICNGAGMPCGLLGTIGAKFGVHRWALDNTTPLPPVLHGLLAQMRRHGAKAVAMEVSSHALVLDRVDDVRFRVAALTNVARDHLDFHETLEAYAAAKRSLFTLAPAGVLNVDDPYGANWARELEGEGRTVVTYGEREDAILVPTQIVSEPDRTLFTLDGRRFELRLPGRFNIWNALAAIGIGRLLGIDDATAAAALERVERVAGRMERLTAGGVAVVVDYAHTPDALENALRSLRETAAGALAVVFGCGGDRDRGKRSQMGAIASALADRAYVTSDNPRSEDPRAIIDDIVGGIEGANYVIESDRRLAIERAIAEARPGDVVLVAGKGHETYQIVGEEIVPFDDAAVACEALAARAPR